MLKTIKGSLTVSMICIVVTGTLQTAVGIIAVAGERTIQDQTQALQLNADKYAEEINTWMENEKMLAPVQILKQFASGDFSENTVVEKAIPEGNKNETEQISGGFQ